MSGPRLELGTSSSDTKADSGRFWSAAEWNKDVKICKIAENVGKSGIKIERVD